MPDEIKTWEVDICYVSDDDTRDKIVRTINQYYWGDNGGDTDGPNYLIESSELTFEKREQFHLISNPGTYLDGYDVEKHQDILYDKGWLWTGWQAEGYALILAPLAEVNQLLSTLPNPNEEDQDVPTSNVINFPIEEQEGGVLSITVDVGNLPLQCGRCKKHQANVGLIIQPQEASQKELNNVGCEMWKFMALCKYCMEELGNGNEEEKKIVPFPSK